MIEGIIEIFIFSYFNFGSANFDSIGEVLGIFQSSLSLILLFFIIPLINIYLLISAYKDTNKLDSEIIK